ncbi:MAG: competence/damage-inducible protein A, partial [Crocinitomicaceae bacterium]|nr:competence/damage-inducible protein A [Crocinitomicaceae bacterium]
MKAILVSIGDELLIGQTVNTNASWLGGELSVRGISISKVLTISDDELEIKEAINESFKSADLIILTGGLGPTKDDITKKVLAEYFDSKFVMNQDALERIRTFFKQRGKEMLEVNELQASLPEKCTVLPNFHGTASGMWFERNGKVLVSLPGVPY